MNQNEFRRSRCGNDEQLLLNTSLSENVKLYVDMFDHGTTIYVFICGDYCIQAISKLKTLS